jgi:hypothetical protein
MSGTIPPPFHTSLCCAERELELVLERPDVAVDFLALFFPEVSG